MRTEPRHIIRRQVLELAAPDRATAETLQPELGRIHRRRLAPLLERCLTKSSPPERIVRIERLELDLGSVDPEHLEQELTDRLGPRLRQALAEHLCEDRRRATGGDEEPGVTSRLELVEHFVRTGRLPWWADASTPRLVEGSLEHLIRHAARPLALWARRLSDPALRRLVLHVDDGSLIALCEALAAAAGGPRSRSDGLQTPLGVQTLLKARPVIPGVPPDRYRTAVRQTLLATAVRDRPRDPASLWEAVLTRLALQLDLPLATLVARLAKSLEVPAEGRATSALSQRVAELAGERGGEEVDERAEDRRQQVREIRATLEHLQRAARDAPKPEEREPPRQTEESGTRAPPPSRELQERIPSEQEASLETAPRAEGLFRSLAGSLERLPAARRERWLAALRELDRRRRTQGWRSPEATDAFVRLLRLATEDRLLPDREMRDHLEALQSRSARLEPEIHQLARRPREPAAKKPRELHEAEGRDVTFTVSTFSDIDTAYVDNAGLVILWPFLGHFFEHLGLMTEKRFHDEAAVHRAVGLLQYLATEDPQPPEYAVALNKVLCGLGVDEVFDFGPAVTDEEAAECGNLLSAVIGHAPILGDMSHTGFRGTFLLRQGALSVEGGSWLLRVERETHDVVLDRFPWSVKWVRLPWMEAPLRVEW